MSEEMKNLNNEPEQAPVEKEEAKKPLDKKNIIIIAAAAVVVVIAIVLALVLGGGQPANNGGNEGGNEGGATLNEYTLGLGVAFGEIKIGEANITAATVVLDKDGKIVACKIDAIQNKFAADFDNDSFSFTKLDTKKELKEAYGMEGNQWSSDNDEDGRVLEWYKQAEAFEAWCVGKTLAEVEDAGKEENLQNAHDHWFTTDADLLAAGCTIQIGDFVKAVVNAGNDEFKVTFKSEGSFTLGLAANNSDNGSSVANDVATIKMNVALAAVVVEGGKTVAVLNDAIQPQITYDYDGNVSEVSVGKGANNLKTKRELKEAYGMEGNQWSSDNDEDGRILEWYKQSAAFSTFVTGKTEAEIKALGAEENLQNKNDHMITTDAGLLAAGCTIQIGDIVDVVVEAIGYTK